MSSDFEMSDMKKFRFLLGGTIRFIVSAMFAWGELTYTIWGSTADATLIRSKEVEHKGRRGHTTREIQVQYHFTDSDGRKRTETDYAPASFNLTAAPGETVKVQYLAAESRLSGNSEKLWVYIFLGFLVAMGVLGVRFWQFYKS